MPADRLETRPLTAIMTRVMLNLDHRAEFSAVALEKPSTSLAVLPVLRKRTQLPQSHMQTTFPIHLLLQFSAHIVI